MLEQSLSLEVFYELVWDRYRFCWRENLELFLEKRRYPLCYEICKNDII